jgi:hypothetical protein
VFPNKLFWEQEQTLGPALSFGTLLKRRFFLQCNLLQFGAIYLGHLDASLVREVVG